MVHRADGSAGLRTISWRHSVTCAAVLLMLFLAGCTTPVSVDRSDPRDVQRELTSNVISTNQLSGPTEIVLRREDLSDAFRRYPEAAIAALHGIAVAGPDNPDLLFALSELSFRHAEDSGKQSYYLAASVYAWAFLFPADPSLRPSAFDPRTRTATDLYNRGLTSAFASADRSRVELRSGTFDLPFGAIDIAFDTNSARWGDLALTAFVPADELHISGLQNRYRQRGIGAPLAAETAAPTANGGFQITPTVKVPMTALLRIDPTQAALAQGRLRGTLTLYSAFDPSSVQITGETVPLEVDTSAAFVYGLSDPKIWQSEFAGFLSGDYFDKDRSPIDGLEPYRPGQIPVIFIHGTGSSSGRWADLINDLQSDPAIREHFQFWTYSYSTGNPTAFSALRLRDAIDETLHAIDPQGKDPALKQIVLVGHSQGGLIAKYLVIDSGSKIWDAASTKPIDELNISPELRDLLRRATFVTPMPQVTRVIFIATPQRGSYVAGSTVGQLLGRLVTLPLTLATTLGEAVTGNQDALTMRPAGGGFGSVWSMTPSNPVLQAFAAIPVAPTVSAHSIIAVQGDGPVETGNDGVVTYKSAHIDEAKSELVVRSGHSVQANPHTVAEVRRILLLHLAQACLTGCPSAVTATAPAPMPAVAAKQ